jgi:hypothetical protein
MVDNSQRDLGAVRLDPELLATPFRVQTNWHAITGAACCGKTTLIDLLADQGFQTVPETARQLMEKEMARGRTSVRDWGVSGDSGQFWQVTDCAERWKSPNQ